MSLIVEQPQLETPVAVRDARGIDSDGGDDIVVLDDGHQPAYDPPSELLLAAASLVFWVGVAVAVRRILAMRRARG